MQYGAQERDSAAVGAEFCKRAIAKRSSIEILRHVEKFGVSPERDLRGAAGGTARTRQIPGTGLVKSRDARDCPGGWTGIAVYRASRPQGPRNQTRLLTSSNPHRTAKFCVHSLVKAARQRESQDTKSPEPSQGLRGRLTVTPDCIGNPTLQDAQRIAAVTRGMDTMHPPTPEHSTQPCLGLSTHSVLPSSGSSRSQLLPDIPAGAG